MPKRPNPLADRMKDYERETRTVIPAQTYTVIRLDGRAFSGYTRGLPKPFDLFFSAHMAQVAKVLAKEVANCRLAYTQSDEISLILTDFALPTTEQWFGGQVQKMVSVSAGIASAMLTRLRPHGDIPHFDSRVFTLPSHTEVRKYLEWRQADAIRNSVMMAAQSQYSHKELHGVSSGVAVMMLREKGIEWSDYPVRHRLGQVVTKEARVEPVTYTDGRSGNEVTINATQTVWVAGDAPKFSDSDIVLRTVPVKEDELVGTGSCG